MMRQSPSRRGVALLLTLAVLVLVLTGIVALVGHAATVQFERGLDRSTRLAGELRRSAEPIVLYWLANESASVVLPPDAATPDVIVCHHLWQVGNREYELRISAWDQCGMVPLALARSGSPLQLALPDATRRQLERLGVRGLHALTGLDQLVDPYHPDHQSPFPLPRETPSTTFHTPGVHPVDEPKAKLPVNAGDVYEIGSLLATHQMTRDRPRSEAPRINVHTAPMSLVEAAMRESGRGGIESIHAARGEGRRINLGNLPRIDRASEFGRTVPTLITTSEVWAIRIDVRVDRVQRSWWRIYQRVDTREMRQNRSDQRLPLTASSVNPIADTMRWECVQSIVITN